MVFIPAQSQNSAREGGEGTICTSQNEIDTNQPKIHRKIDTNLWILIISRKTKPNKNLENFCDFQKET
jgi:hypothetical protein